MTEMAQRVVKEHIWFPIYMGSHYGVQISHKVHHHVLTFFWVKPHTVFHTIIMYIFNSKTQQATQVTWYCFKNDHVINILQS